MCVYKLVLSVIRVVYFLLSNLEAYYFIFLPNCPGRTSTTMNRNGKNSFLALFLILGKSCQSFTIEYDVRCVFFRCLSQVEEVPFCSSFYVVLSWRSVEFFVRCFSRIYWGDSVVCPLFGWCDNSTALTVLYMLNHPCIPGINPIWSWCRLLFIYVLPCSFFLSSVQEVTTFYGVFAVLRMWAYGWDTSSLYFWLEKSGGVSWPPGTPLPHWHLRVWLVDLRWPDWSVAHNAGHLLWTTLRVETTPPVPQEKIFLKKRSAHTENPVRDPSPFPWLWPAGEGSAAQRTSSWPTVGSRPGFLVAGEGWPLS